MKNNKTVPSTIFVKKTALCKPDLLKTIIMLSTRFCKRKKDTENHFNLPGFIVSVMQGNIIIRKNGEECQLQKKNRGNNLNSIVQYKVQGFKQLLVKPKLIIAKSFKTSIL